MLKNYTSSVPAARSIAWIEAKLVQHKANMVVKIYSPEGTVESIVFEVRVNETPLTFRLPAQIGACKKTLLDGLGRRARPETRDKIKNQAERTAWKIVADWVDAQMAMIDLSQVDLLEVFLPYVYDRNRNQTYYQSIKEQRFRALLPASE